MKTVVLQTRNCIECFEKPAFHSGHVKAKLFISPNNYVEGHILAGLCKKHEYLKSDSSGFFKNWEEEMGIEIGYSYESI